ncbi:ribosome maturation factor RimM [Paractinoplanes atraurantiacus]|uniref:Ribosome maturation factor RimM n=1 Tax=Paractinoplanes atraurantiacus TaxID=1036182 RepID=A0A285FST1_9ACTN|nr:ribosome maturation factor RimM [Actinoplanes atraurantiacus]SNY14380.1 16S rRNA processing protein RimM [Actinoplanes atraurantiacus]
MLLVVGQIGKPHGIRGEVSVVVRTDEPEVRFVPGSVFVTEVPKDRRVSTGPAAVPAGAVFQVPKQLVLEQIRWHQGRGIAVFENIYDRNIAEALRGVWLQVDSDSLAPPEDPDEFHDHQLVGLRVESASGELYGTVERIEHAPSSDLIVLSKVAGGTALIPFVSAIVPTVDLAGGRIVVDLPEGLLDL